ncbi:Hypothetical protein SRAE_0000054300 [Strongyloides ratti]|uniref:RNA-directed DNA polymerase n=1 Tax=Strongyloides ratti TaxID=34506 RepID=A0A090L1P8_STRRB|nr:Hypothetical protein SRAE_0000054300 [Strongyloides ratti]CEF61419.1 Hypothetical protein SRAE_0000054300 [Strongyloides ratti]
MKEFEKIKYQLSETRGFVMRGEQIYIPKASRKDILKKLHEDHIGTVRMKILTRSNFFWINMNAQIEEITKECDTCMSIGLPIRKLFYHFWKQARESFDRVHIDLCGPIAGEMYVVIYDAYTCYPFVERIKNTDSENIIEILDLVLSFSV